MNALSHRELEERMNHVGESVAKHLGFKLRLGQETAGKQMLRRCIVEMPTGEGKTAAAVFPAATLATTHRNVLVATANDYLASRDANWMRPVYKDLGLKVGCVSALSSKKQRTEAYESSITYGTLREFGFDFLRASLDRQENDQGRGLPTFAFDALIIDEADSVLIDEAPMPMVITAPTRGIDTCLEACYRWTAEFAPTLQASDDFVQTETTGAIALTREGHEKFIRASMPPAIKPLTTTEIIHTLERAIWVNENMRPDHDYVVSDNRVCLVDEYTGRKSTNRKFGSGVQQAIEAREGLTLTPESQPVAQISVQEFVSKFKHLSGITATAAEDRHELHRVYGLDVHTIEPHQPSQRCDLEPCVARSKQEKLHKIAEETKHVLLQNRAVLIGTCSIAQSETLSDFFDTQSIEHVVLNAKNHEQEAGIVAQAGQPRRVTIATNMAGRGTDIPLDPKVAEAGGLHVIVSQMHAAKRIDLQLRGRCARAGDPGTTRTFIGSHDPIFRQALGDEQADRFVKTALKAKDSWICRQAEQAQRRVATMHRQQRERLAQHEQEVAKTLTTIGLDPYLDPLPSDT